MKNFKFIPYDKKLVSRARELRKGTTDAESAFWRDILKRKELANFKFTRQKPLGNFIVDFYCAKLSLAIEIDGEIHNFQRVRDLERDNLLGQRFGITILRYKNEEVLETPEKILNDLLKVLNTTPP